MTAVIKHFPLGCGHHHLWYHLWCDICVLGHRTLQRALTLTNLICIATDLGQKQRHHESPKITAFHADRSSCLYRIIIKIM